MFRQSMMVITVLSLGGAISGCLDERRVTDQLPADGAALPIIRHWSRTHSHEQRAMRLAIRNAADLSQIPLEEFNIDFESEMALIVTLGRMPSEQFQAQIAGVRRDRGRLIVDVKIVQPPVGAPFQPASPYCIAIVPRCDLPVEGFATRPPPRQRGWSQSELGAGR